MLSKSLQNDLNNQLKDEFFASHFYVALAAYCDSKELPGMAQWFHAQSNEERGHAMKIYTFLVEKDQPVTIHGIDTPQIVYKSIHDAFLEAASHEAKVTKQLYKIMDRAVKEKEHSTVSFLKWFIDEQVEEESLFRVTLKSLKRVGNDGPGLLYLDREMGKRTSIRK